MLTINNKKIDQFKSKLIDRKIESNEVITVDDWLDGSIQPVFIRQQESFKSIKLSILLIGDDENDAYMQFSKLTKELKNGELKFDDINLTFKVFINGVVSPKRLKPNVFEIEYTLKSGYGMTAEKTISREAGSDNTFTIDNSGTAPTPCIIEIMPFQDIISLTIKGVSQKEIKINNITGGQKVVINGEENSILMNDQNGFANFDGWEFPRLNPGLNTVKVSTTLGYAMNIKYRSRYI